MSQLRTSSVSHKDASNDNIKLKVDGSSIAGRETVAGDESLTLATKGYVDANGGGGGDGANVSVGENPPTGAAEGDLWWDSSDGGGSNGGRMYVYYSGQWVQSSNVGGSAEGGGGDGDTIYNGASAWGTVNPDGTKAAPGLNYTSTRTGEGAYTITFVTPMPDNQYSVQALAAASATGAPGVNIVSTSSNSFDLITFKTTTGVLADNSFSFAVFATNALPPKGGTGTDAWSLVEASGNVLASFNIASVTRSAPGTYDYVFTTPMPTANYAVQATTEQTAFSPFEQPRVRNLSITGFTVTMGYIDNTNALVLADTGHSVAVNATNAQLPNTVTQEQIEAAINNPGLSAWGNVANDGSFNGGLNANSTRTAAGQYTVTFTNPMPDNNYSITFGGAAGVVQILGASPTGFNVSVVDTSGTVQDAGFLFMVAATNALPPKGGTGSDAWGATSDDNGSIASSFNIQSITNTGTGLYSVVFTTPMPTADYAVVASVMNAGTSVATSKDRTVNGFTMQTRDANTNLQIDRQFAFSVFATNAQLPDSFTKEEIQEILDFIDNGGSGGGSGADAWATVYGTTVQNGMNIASVTNPETGQYTFTFTTPMPNQYYAVTATAAARSCGVLSQSANAFTLGVYNLDSGNPENANSVLPIDVVVNASNTIAPQAGVGADAWGFVASDGTLNSGFNCSSSYNPTPNPVYSVTFNTPMPNADYSVLVTAGNSAFADTRVSAKTANGFEYITSNVSGISGTNNANFAVFASSTITPTFTWTRNGTTLKPANAGDIVEVEVNGRTQDESAIIVDNSNSAGYNFVSRSSGTTTAYIDTAGNITADGNITAAGGVTNGPYDSGNEKGKGNFLSSSGGYYAQCSTDDGQTRPVFVGRYGKDINTTITASGDALFEGTVTANGSILTRSSGNMNVGDELENAKNALTSIKAAVSDSNTDLAGLKAAILAALSNH